MELAVKRKHERANIPAFNPFGSDKDEVDVPSFKYWNRLQVFRILSQSGAQVGVDYFDLVVIHQEYLGPSAMMTILPDDHTFEASISMIAAVSDVDRTYAFFDQFICG